ncbi:4Fe-4S single cluster domain-containing protein [Thioflexithrix psekupsensis]|uniref:Radical SAM core domain-containing protein n=1 Tax=Thioflexithrix psekupsensis TaxID=1570016 RepID=A0A251X8Q6_9GAMM|nr:4Fe-4S single cluster domain-containing protein [Thioflexithrix psekupsensis]OUD14315.1 hypothetical protein TPSD3_08305 [Thioflexithrix psekupsensis]
MARETDYLSLYARVAPTRVLGTGQRYGLWVQGCPFRCLECMTPESLPFAGGERVAVAELAQEMLATPDVEGITITGGEPFAQAAALGALVAQLKEKEWGVIVYTGYVYEQLLRLGGTNAALRNFLSHIDVLIDGQYEAERNEGTSLRGSSNQRIICLTPRYAPEMEQITTQKQRAVEIHLLESFALLVGVPGAETLRQWKQGFSISDPCDD